MGAQGSIEVIRQRRREMHAEEARKGYSLRGGMQQGQKQQCFGRCVAHGMWLKAAENRS